MGYSCPLQDGADLSWSPTNSALMSLCAWQSKCNCESINWTLYRTLTDLTAHIVSHWQIEKCYGYKKDLYRLDTKQDVLYLWMTLQKSNLMKRISLLLRNWINRLVNRSLNTYSAMSRYPQEAAAWRGIQPSLSGWLMLAPCSTRKVTMSTLSSMHAWERGRERDRRGVRPL